MCRHRVVTAATACAEGPGSGEVLPTASRPCPGQRRPTPLCVPLGSSPRLALPSVKGPGTGSSRSSLLPHSWRLHSSSDSHLQQGRPHLPVNWLPPGALLSLVVSLVPSVAKLLMSPTQSAPPNQPQAPPTRLPAAMATRLFPRSLPPHGRA